MPGDFHGEIPEARSVFRLLDSVIHLFMILRST